MKKITSEKIRRRSFLGYKEVVQYFRHSSDSDKKILCIFGCQRSGTTLLLDLFERDMRVKAFEEEHTSLSTRDLHGIRLDPLHLVGRRFNRVRAPLIVLKPLVETQYVPEILAFFPSAHGVWMHRHYRDVAFSNNRLFGPHQAIDDLTAVALDRTNDWRNERVPEETRATVRSLFSPEMLPLDAAALFWYVRCSLFYQLELEKLPRFHMVRYNDLVTNQREQIERIYSFIGMRAPLSRSHRHVHTRSIGRGAHIALSSEVSTLCEELHRRLEASFARLELDEEGKFKPIEPVHSPVESTT